MAWSLRVLVPSSAPSAWLKLPAPAGGGRLYPPSLQPTSTVKPSGSFSLDLSLARSLSKEKIRLFGPDCDVWCMSECE